MNLRCVHAESLCEKGEGLTGATHQVWQKIQRGRFYSPFPLRLYISVSEICFHILSPPLFPLLVFTWYKEFTVYINTLV